MWFVFFHFSIYWCIPCSLLRSSRLTPPQPQPELHPCRKLSRVASLLLCFWCISWLNNFMSQFSVHSRSGSFSHPQVNCYNSVIISDFHYISIISGAGRCWYKLLAGTSWIQSIEPGSRDRYRYRALETDLESCSDHWSARQRGGDSTAGSNSSLLINTQLFAGI